MTLKTREVTINSCDGVVLSGTSVVPTNPSRSPGVLLLSGSGPLDRDSNSPGQRLDISSTLAAELGVLGIASLRFDKRGVGASSGDFVSTSFEEEIADAAAALDAFRGFDTIDPCRVGIIGHSVGATIAARLAATDKAVAFAVLLGCAASSGAEVMAWQTERIAAAVVGPCVTLVPDDLTHILRSSTHQPSIARYPPLLEHPVDNDLVETVSNWILDRTKVTPVAVDPDEQPA